MKKVFLITIIATLYLSAFGQVAPEKQIEQFFKEYKDSPNLAITNLYSHNPWNSRMQDEIETLKNTFSQLTIDYVGEYYGYEFITKKQFLDCYMLYSYIIKYDRQPLRFIFEFYKAKDEWRIHFFLLDTNIDDELEESVKLSRLNLEPEK